MSSGDLFANLNIILCLCAGVSYAIRKDVGRAVYWLCAFGITFAVTYLMKGKA